LPLSETRSPFLCLFWVAFAYIPNARCMLILFVVLMRTQINFLFNAWYTGKKKQEK
jgi:hypothetical protein